MIKKIALIALCAILTMNCFAAFIPVAISSGFNADIVANGVGAASASTTLPADNGTYSLVAKGWSLTASSTPTNTGLPANGILSSEITNGLKFQLGNYSENNALQLSTWNASGTLVFQSPLAGRRLYVLAHASVDTAAMNIVINFIDGTAISAYVSVHNWLSSPPYAVNGIGRINRMTNTVENLAAGPGIQQFQVDLYGPLQSKMIQSVTIEKPSFVGTLNAFAVTVETVPITPGTITTANNGSCITPPAILSLSGNTQPGVVSYQWQRSSDSVNFNNVGNVSGTPGYIAFQPVSATEWFRCQQTCCGDSPVYSPAIRLNYCPMGVAQYSPSSGGNTGDITMTISGQGFGALTRVRLKKSGHPDIAVPDSLLIVQSPASLQATFNLRLADTGLYDLEISNSLDTVTYTNGFRINPGLGSKIWLMITGAGGIRPGQWQPHEIRYGNSGDINAIGVPIYIAVPASAELRLKNTILDYNIDSTAFLVQDSLTPVLIDSVFEGDVTYKIYTLFAPCVPAGRDGTILLQLRSSEAIRLKCWSAKPLYGSPINPTFTSCSATIIERVWNDIKGDIDPLKQLHLNNCFTDFYDGLFRPFISIFENKGISDDYSSTFGLYRGKLGWFVDFGRSVTKAFVDGINCVTDAGGGLTDLEVAALKNTMMKKIVSRAALVLALEEAFETGFGLGEDIAEGLNDCGVFDYLVQEKVTIPIINSIDPNAKYGPLGAGQHNYLPPLKTVAYSIHFENDSSASGAAQKVKVIDTLDLNTFEVSSLQQGMIQVGDTTIYIEGGVKAYKKYIDFRPRGKNYILEIEGKVNDLTGIATWQFATLDPATMLPVTDPLSGFLPPNHNAPEGQGSVSFSVKLKEGIGNHATIANRAHIFFDNNAPIATDTWTNKLDKTKPSSVVTALPVYTLDTAFQVAWHGADSGSGIKNYSVYVSVNGGDFNAWKFRTRDTTAIYHGAFDSTYSFYAIAMDTAGNLEDKPLAYDATTRLINCAQRLVTGVDTIGATSFCYGNTLRLIAFGGNSHQWNNGSVTDTLRVSNSGTYNVLTSDTFGCTQLSGDIQVTVYALPVIALSIGDTTLCRGDSVVVTVSGGLSCLWAHDTTAGYTLVLKPDTTASFYVSVVDSNLCSNADSFTLSVRNLSTIAIDVDSAGVCLGEDITLHASGGVLYTWYPGAIQDSTIVVAPSAALYYYLRGADDHNCYNYDSAWINVWMPPAAPLLTFSGGYLLSNYPSGNQWYLDSVLIPAATNDSLMPGAPGRYYVVFTDSNGCSAASAPYLYEGLGVIDRSGLQHIQLFPNPVLHELVVRGEHSYDQSIRISLINAVGQECLSRVVKPEAGQFNTRINMSSVAPGFYMVVIRTAKGNLNYKIVVK
ncbi:T9SS type A sorting domain-containing protein [Taibaiella chishuiensis]|uniref:Putative secreted protein (Por secretion system target) n=1 Tax=Taibaiella chishuiensis TaxID=1434707 RepID=A0A2P8D1Z8_9BACT|nr:T9SS type A sorting domain-containing protein [Taibaiella chishuiensis]PSK91250.1 putative secreted protein (Por secretion system target) [Taibaiella chishuiensis]